MNLVDIRLKIRHWFRRYKNIIFIVAIIWGVIFLVNRFLSNYKPEQVPNTTRDATVATISGEKAPSKVQTVAEERIEEYVGYCNEGNYKKAFNMLSDDCKKYEFGDDLQNFAKHVLVKMPNPREYSIQDYSNYGDYYIYEVKYIDNILSTGLTNQDYAYSTEKITFTKNSQGGYDMSAGNFVKHEMINNIAENEYLKVDVIDRIVNYSIEKYKVKFTNRTDSTVVIHDNIENDEINLVLSQEFRSQKNPDGLIVLGPNEQKEASLIFTKFADDGEKSEGILFSSIRVIEDYKGSSGTEEEQKAEIENAIAKFSMQVPVKK